MDEQNWLVEQFEAHRKHMQAMAHRMLGSLSEAEDAVQESWLRFSRGDTSKVENIGGWLTTIVSRVCLDMLRSRKSRREKLMGPDVPEPVSNSGDGSDPEHEALLADSIGLALLVVLNNLNPAERITFVLHDIFALPYVEIAPIVGRNEAATRQLASRARRRLHGAETALDINHIRQRNLVEAFLTASKTGDFDTLLAVLDPDVVFRNDPAFFPAAAFTELRGAESVAKQFLGRAHGARPLLVNGGVGVVVAPRGQLLFVLEFTITDGKIVKINLVSDPARVRQLDLTLLND